MTSFFLLWAGVVRAWDSAGAGRSLQAALRCASLRPRRPKAAGASPLTSHLPARRPPACPLPRRPQVIVKKGEGELPGLTDEEKPRQRGPKRASKIRKMFNLTK